MSGIHKRLPNLALLHFAVAEHGVNVDVLFQILCGVCHTGSRADALAERAGAHINTGGHIHIRMSLQERADVAQLFQLVNREKSLVSQRAVYAGRAVALGEHKAVSVLPSRFVGTVAHFLAVKIRKHVRRGKRSARMTGLCTVNAFDYAHSDLCGKNLKFFFLFSIHKQRLLI